MSEAMKESELNKCIAEKVFGECWHEPQRDDSWRPPKWNCSKCGIKVVAIDDNGVLKVHENFDHNYTRSLDAVSKAEAKVIEKEGGQRYWDALQDSFDWPRDGGTDYVDELEMVTASARKRCEAIYKLLEATA